MVCVNAPLERGEREQVGVNGRVEGMAVGDV